MKLRHLADIQNSNVDKIIVAGEQKVRLCNYVDVYKNDFITANLDFNAGSATAAEIARFHVKVGDVIITKDSEDRHDIGIPAYVRETAEDLVCGYHLTMLRAFRKRGDGAFLFWALQSKTVKEAFAIAANGVTRYGLTQEGIKGLSLWVPDLPTQKRIAAFLDRETARIDELIAKKERLVEVVSAKEIMVRDTFITKGMKEHEMKPSGVDWFGDVPSHWTVCRFNRLISSKVDYRGRTPEKVEDGVFLVTARNIRNGFIDYERSQEFTTENDWAVLSARGLPEIGDILFTTEAPLGQIAQVDRTDVAFAQRIIKFRAKSSMVSNDFLAQLMMTSEFQRSLQLYSSGSTAAGIKSERIAHLFGLVPPQEEQEQIVKSLRAEIAKLAGLVSPIKESIDRLREYRTALITAAVTGQIDVDTYGKTGTTSATLERIEEEMSS